MALLHWDDLLPTLLRAAAPLPTNRVAVAAAHLRVLRAPAAAAWDLPRDDNAAMDGVAVRATDTAPGAALRITGTAYAGAANLAPVGPGQAARIGTGGRLPPGADTVVAREDFDDHGDTVVLRAAARPGGHVRRRGEELGQGDPVGAPGRRLDAWHLAALDAAGVGAVDVGRAPSLALITTGSELVAPGTAPGPGQVVDSNGGMLRRALGQWRGLIVPPAEHVGDDADALRRALTAALARADLVITSGGVSVGDRDLVRRVAAELGVETVFAGIAVKPGKPLYLGRRGDCLLLGLPGNPASAAVALPVAVLPLVDALEGAADPGPTRIAVRLTAPCRRSADRTELVWGLVEDGARDLPGWRPLDRRGSHMLSDLARADALAVLPPGAEPLPAGAVVTALPRPGAW